MEKCPLLEEILAVWELMKQINLLLDNRKTENGSEDGKNEWSS